MATVSGVTKAITIYFLGGTISMSGAGGGVVSRLGGADLLAAVPGLDGLDAEITAVDFRRMPSADLTVQDLLELRSRALEDNADGVVVVQGTDTIEESAFVLDLVWDDAAPVVVTGAMRNPTLAGPDGPANLLAAVTVAADEQARGRGVLVVLNDEIHAARFVNKRHSTSPGAFVSPNFGPLGRLTEGRAVFGAALPARPALPAPASATASVPLVTATLGGDGRILDGIEHRVDALVVAGFGGGHVPGPLAERLGAVAAAIPVVLANRTGAGPVLRRTYGARGSEIDLIARGLIPAGLLDPLKARLLLMLLVSGGADRAAVTAAFDTYG